MYNLIIDVSNAFHRIVYTIPKIGSPDQPLLEDQEEQEIFIDRCITDIGYILGTFERVDRLIFAMDDYSWRKGLLEAEGQYKKDRDKSKVNYNIFWNCIDKVLEHYEDSFTIKVKGLEADDIMYLLSKKFSEKNEYSIIVSSDSDFYQLLSDKVIIYNPNSRFKKVLTCKEFTYQDNEDSIIDVFESKKDKSIFDIFDVSNISFSKVKPSSFFNKIYGSLDVEEKDSYDEIFLKILNGDDGDNVPSTYSWKSKTGNPVRVTARYSQKVLDDVKVSNKFDISEMVQDENIEFIRSSLSRHTKVHFDSEEFKKNLYRNWKLIYLSHITIPEEYINIFENVYLEIF